MSSYSNYYQKVNSGNGGKSESKSSYRNPNYDEHGNPKDGYQRGNSNSSYQQRDNSYNKKPVQQKKKKEPKPDPKPQVWDIGKTEFFSIVHRILPMYLEKGMKSKKSEWKKEALDEVMEVSSALIERIKEYAKGEQKERLKEWEIKQAEIQKAREMAEIARRKLEEYQS